MIWDITFAMLAIVATAYLLRRTLEWWWVGSTMRSITNPERHRVRMAEWQRHIDQAQAQLAYYQATPNWFDLEWPVCDALDVSTDGEYCRKCFRQVSDHAMRVAA